MGGHGRRAGRDGRIGDERGQRPASRRGQRGPRSDGGGDRGGRRLGPPAPARRPRRDLGGHPVRGRVRPGRAAPLRCRRVPRRSAALLPALRLDVHRPRHSVPRPAGRDGPVGPSCPHRYAGPSVGGRHGRRAGLGRHRGRSAGPGLCRPARLGPAPTGGLLRLADRPVGRCRAVSGRGSPPLRGRRL